VRATDGIVELFVMKADDIALLSFSEFGSRRKARFEQVRTASGYMWMLNKGGADSDRIKELMRSCLTELDQPKEPEDESNQVKATERTAVGDPVQQLMLEKENLIFKVLNQQETIKNELARSLHDTVLADLLMLKRHMRGDQELSKEDIIETIDEISQQLRDICNECAPRNLHDWGLKVSVQDLLNRFGQRTAIETMLQCEIDIPNLPAVVELHIFRLIQESLNNIEKHARATQVKIFIESLKEHSLRFRVVDNGKGFDSTSQPRSTDSGGMGLTGMRERTQLVRCFYPTEFAIDSEPGNGTTISLELIVQG
jgi:signal transduction histidine kinase